MSPAADGFAELREILEALCEERLTAAQTVRLEELALHDTSARRFYLEYIELHGNLHWDAAQGHFAGERDELFAEEEPDPTPRHRRSRVTAAVVSSETRESRETPVRRSPSPYFVAVIAGAAIAAALIVAVWTRSPLAPVVDKPPAVAVEHHVRALPQKHAANEGDRRKHAAVAPAGAADAARPKTSAAAARPSAATVAVHRRPARFHLTVAKNNGPAVKASLVPLDVNRSPLSPAHVPLETPAPSSAAGAADEGPQGPASLGAFIDARIMSGWTSAGIEPSPIATDEEWIRRVYLDVVGHIPPEEAVDAFLKSGDEHKRGAVVDGLLRDSGYARNWATLWANLLVGRQPRTPGVRRDELEKFLRDSFAANVPWNEIVNALVSAEGTAEQNPAANFLLAHLNQDAVPATA